MIPPQAGIPEELEDQQSVSFLLARLLVLCQEQQAEIERLLAELRCAKPTQAAKADPGAESDNKS